MNTWNELYLHFDPVAFSIFGIKVHWYGIMYVLALLVALAMGKYFVKKDNIPIKDALLDNYFFWVEIGVILGARLGYVFIYSDETIFYVTQPWQIFNPFYNGEFIGIRGMSYHGAVIGFLIATFAFCKRYDKQWQLSLVSKNLNKKSSKNENSKNQTLLWTLLDLCALSIPLGYFFGRIGNFLNQELFGRVTDVSWAIKVGGVMRHPSQIYEAVLEGLIVFIILFFYRKFKKFDGELIAMYAILYAITRFICEYFREPDYNIGFVFLNLSMGHLLSLVMFLFGIFTYFFIKKRFKFS